MMRELSLFTGGGGGLLGTHFLLGWETIGAVEIEDYPCRIIEQRQRDYILPRFPVWNMDIREFNRRIAPMYKGVVDVISAGFPCQPFSVAGKQRGHADERNMWPATIECIQIVRPKYCLLENVPGLLGAAGESGEWDLDEAPDDNLRYFGTILADLSEARYDARWITLGACDVGANHRRKRVWILCSDTSSKGLEERWASRL